MAQFLQPDHSRGDANTLEGYRAVHERPAAFEGSDGYSYSAEILVGETGEAEPSRRAGACLFFVQWARIGASAPMGHLESDWLAFASTEEAARATLGAMALSDVKRVLDALIAERLGGEAPRRRWWDAMAADDPAGDA